MVLSIVLFPEVVTEKYHECMCCNFTLVKKFQNLIKHFFSFLWFSPSPFSLVTIIMYCIHCFEKQSEEKEPVITVCCYLKILLFVSMKHLKWTSTGIVSFCYYSQPNVIENSSSSLISSCCNLLFCPIALTIKDIFLIASLNVSSLSFRPLLLILPESIFILRSFLPRVSVFSRLYKYQKRPHCRVSLRVLWYTSPLGG